MIKRFLDVLYQLCKELLVDVKSLQQSLRPLITLSLHLAEVDAPSQLQVFDFAVWLTGCVDLVGFLWQSV